MTQNTDVLVIGGGQAGLCLSHSLHRRGVEHLVLEREAIGARWRRHWDSFTLVTPNALNRLPGPPSGGAPDGFLARDEVIGYLEHFAASFDPPVRIGVEVERVTPAPTGERFLVETSEGTYACRQVVVATGTFQNPRPPELAQQLPVDVAQLHSDAYRNPGQLPPGAVLVVGSSQSGAQIADELLSAGREVFLSVSGAGRLPRRYRGRDTMRWLYRFGAFDRTLDMLDSPDERFAAHPHVSGRDGGKTLDLREFARRGATLLGRVRGVEGNRLRFADDLGASLQAADTFAAKTLQLIDERIAAEGLEAHPPEPDAAAPAAGHPQDGPRELSLKEAGIGAVVWATGFAFDYGWLNFPVLDAAGYPRQRRGVTDVPGLYFAGLHWLHKHKSGLLCGVADDADHVATQVARAAARAD